MTTPLAGTFEGYLALSAHPAVCDLVADPRMALVFDRTGERTLWLNAAAARFCRLERPFGAEASPSPRLQAVRASLAEHVQARYVPRQGLVRLRVFLDFRPVWLTCRIDPISLPGGEPGLLALVEDPVPSGLEKLQARVEAVCRLVAHDGLAVVADSGGGIVASAGDASLAVAAGGPEAVVRAARAGDVAPPGGLRRALALELPNVGLTLFVLRRDIAARPVDPAVETAPNAAAPDAPTSAPTEAPRPVARSRRFSWQSDAEGRFRFLSHELSEAVGVPAEDLRGRTLAEIATAYGLVGAEAALAAFESRATWSGVSVHWPLSDGTLAPIDLAGLSVYEADGTFKGFRGFGLIRSPAGTVAPAPSACASATEATLPAAVAEVAKGAPMDSIGSPPAPSVAPENVTAPNPISPIAGFSPESPALAASPGEPEPRAPWLTARLAAVTPDTGRDAVTPTPRDDEPNADGVAAADGEGVTIRDEAIRDRAAEEFEAAGFEIGGFETGLFELNAFEQGSFARRPLDLSGAESAVVEFWSEAPTTGEITPEESPSETMPSGEAVSAASEIDAQSISEPGSEVSTGNEAPQAPVFADPAPEAVSADFGASFEEAGDAPASESDAPAPAAREPEREGLKVVPMPGLAAPPAEPSGAALSRPEWEAFRLIAAALGARFEGDDAGAEAEAEEPETLYPLGEPAISPVGRLAANDSGIVEVDTRILDRLPLGLVACRGAAIIYANPAALMLAGYPDLAALDAAGGLEGLFAERSEPEGERPVTIRRGDGRLVEVDARMHSVPWGAGRALLVALQSRGEFQAAAPAAPAPSDAAEVFDAIADAVVVVDRAAAIVSLNRAAERLFGRSRAALAGESLMRLVDPDSHRALRAGIAAVIDSVIPTNAGRDIEIVGLAAEGDEIPLQVGFGRYGAGVGARACLTLRDVTPWKRGEAAMAAMARAAERASAQKSDFLARITHEIRTPLNAILGFAEVMLEERLGPIGTPRYRDYLGDIHASGGHILSLVNDLLNLARIEAGKAELDLRPVALDQAVRDCVALMQPQASAERVIVRTSLGAQLPAVLADARSIKQIVLNLLSNAIKFNMIGGQVIVSTTRDASGGVVLRFRDTGIGMAEADIPAALEPFRRLHPSHHEGTGLGLPLTKALAEANGATFAIESAPNQGTLVEIRFPAARLAAE